MRRCRGSKPGYPRNSREYSLLYYNDFLELGLRDDFFSDSASRFERGGYGEDHSLETWVVSLGMLQNSSPKHNAVVRDGTRVTHVTDGNTLWADVLFDNTFRSERRRLGEARSLETLVVGLRML